MGRVLESVAAQTVTFSANTTYYLACGSGQLSAQTSEVLRQIIRRTAGRLRGLNCRVGTIASGTTTITARKDGVDQTMAVSFSATGLVEDVTNVETVTAGEKWSYSLVVGTGNVTIIGVSWAFTSSTAGSSTKRLCAVGAGAAMTQSNVTRVVSLCGSAATDVSGNEGNAKQRIHQAFTASSLMAYVSANTRTNETTIRLRINGANGNSVVSVPGTGGSPLTGAYEDTTHTDSVAANDDLNYAVVLGVEVTGSLTVDIVSVELTDTTGRYWISAVGALAGDSISNNTTLYMSLDGQAARGNNELNNSQRARMHGIALNLSILVSANSVNASSSLTFRVNQVDTPLTVSIGSAATGLFESSPSDLSSTTFFPSANVVCKIVTGGSAGTMTWRQYGCSYSLAPVSPPNSLFIQRAVPRASTF